jgi:hypothetical protein
LEGLGGWVPPRLVTDEELPAARRTGIATRHWALADTAAREDLRPGEEVLLTAFAA